MDLSILNIDDGVFDILSTNGDNQLGGELFTKQLFNYVVNLLKNKNIKNLSNKNKIDIMNQCENIKKNIKNINYIKTNSESLQITNLDINDLFKNILNKITNYIDETLDLANLEVNDIDYVVLVGGSTKMNLIKYHIESYLKNPYQQ